MINNFLINLESGVKMVKLMLLRIFNINYVFWLLGRTCFYEYFNNISNYYFTGIVPLKAN